MTWNQRNKTTVAKLHHKNHVFSTKGIMISSLAAAQPVFRQSPMPPRKWYSPKFCGSILYSPFNY